MTTTASPVTVHPAIVRAIDQSGTHYDLAQHATTEAEKRAHLSTMRALNKAAIEMAKGNMPRRIGDGIYLCESRTNAGVVYRVDVYAQLCQCANRDACWHLAGSNVCEEVAAQSDDVTALDIAEHVALANDGQAPYAPCFDDGAWA